LWSIIKPKGGEFEIEELSGIKKIDNLSSGARREVFPLPPAIKIPNSF